MYSIVTLLIVDTLSFVALAVLSITLFRSCLHLSSSKKSLIIFSKLLQPFTSVIHSEMSKLIDSVACQLSLGGLPIFQSAS